VRQGSDCIGSVDLQTMIESIEESVSWVENIFKDKGPQKGTAETSELPFAISPRFFLARWIVFDTFIRVARELNDGALPENIRRDWLLFQILPLDLDDRAIFLKAIRCLDYCLNSASSYSIDTVFFRICVSPHTM
jgi:hypothetical protein